MKKRFTEEQIIAILKEAESGLSAREVCRRYGISDHLLYLAEEIRRIGSI